MVQGLESARFKRVRVEASTIISMAKSNATHFPNNGNGRVATAGCKCLLLTDLLSGDVLTADLHNARDSDQALAGEILEHCRADDLIVRDMRFFNPETLHQIESRNAFWISRLPASVSLTTNDGTELRNLLKRTRGKRIDRTVIVGRDARRRVPCRLVATRLKHADADKNRRMRKREAKKRGATASEEGLLRDGWRLLITKTDPLCLPIGHFKDASLALIGSAPARGVSTLVRNLNFPRGYGSGSKIDRFNLGGETGKVVGNGRSKNDAGGNLRMKACCAFLIGQEVL